MAKDKSKVFASIARRASKAWKSSRKVEASARGRRLPAGLINAVGKVQGFTVDEDKKGNPYVFIKCICLEPEDVKGTPFRLAHFIRPTKTQAIEQVLERFANDLKLLGCDEDEVNKSDISDWEGLLKELVSRKPVFLFNTWAPADSRPGSDPFVNVQRVVEDGEETEEEEEEEEEEEAEEAEEGTEEEEESEEEESEEEETEEETEEEEESEEEEAEEATQPKKGDIYLLKTSPKSKPAKCKVTAISKPREVATMKRLEDGKVFKDVPWEKLLPAD